MHEKMREVKGNGGRFAYYTSAETAFRILDKKEVWMRSTSVMNDFMEVEYGLDCLRAAYNDDELHPKFKTAIDTCFSGLTAEIQDLFNGWIPHIREDTYITCISEHNIEEDAHGRLSMWRAYGGRSGVALIFNGEPMFGTSNALAAQSSPVGYLTREGMRAQFIKAISNITESTTFIQTLERENVKQIVFSMLRYAALCTKHPGFHEEKEWRIIASPKLYGEKLLESSIEVVRGIPQPIKKIKLKDHPDEGLVGLELPKLLDRVIIGPTEFPKEIKKAFTLMLEEAGVPDAGKKIIISDIPLRQMG